MWVSCQEREWSGIGTVVFSRSGYRGASLCCPSFSGALALWGGFVVSVNNEIVTAYGGGSEWLCRMPRRPSNIRPLLYRWVVLFSNGCWRMAVFSQFCSTTVHRKDRGSVSVRGAKGAILELVNGQAFFRILSKILTPHPQRWSLWSRFSLVLVWLPMYRPSRK